MGKTFLPSDNGKKSKRKEKPLSSLMPMRKITKRTSTLKTDHMEASTSKASNKRRIVTAKSSKEQQQKNGNEENTEKIPRNFDLNIPLYDSTDEFLADNLNKTKNKTADAKGKGKEKMILLDYDSSEDNFDFYNPNDDDYNDVDYTPNVIKSKAAADRTKKKNNNNNIPIGKNKMVIDDAEDKLLSLSMTTFKKNQKKRAPKNVTKSCLNVIPKQVNSNVALTGQPSFSNMELLKDASRAHASVSNLASLELTLGMRRPESSSAMHQPNVAPMLQLPPYEEAVFSIKTRKLTDGIFPGVWLTLRPAQYQGYASLPPIFPVPNFRVMEPNVEVDEIRKYVARKLEMPNSSEVEIMLDNDSLTVKEMSISSMLQIWCRIQINRGQEILTIAGNSGPEFVLPLTYAWKPSSR